MNGVSGVSFRETEKGLEVRVHKSKSSSSGKLKKGLCPLSCFKDAGKAIMAV